MMRRQRLIRAAVDERCAADLDWVCDGRRLAFGTREMTRTGVVEREVGASLVLELVLEDERWGDEAVLQRRLDEIAPKIAAHPAARIIDRMIATVVLADDAVVRDLNARFRHQDKATNVLSFPAGETVGGDADEPVLLGDVILAYETVEREAETDGVTRDHHLAHLVVHGVLHLVGHDHIDEGEATVMEAVETTILATLGIGDPYAELG